MSPEPWGKLGFWVCGGQGNGTDLLWFVGFGKGIWKFLCVVVLVFQIFLDNPCSQRIWGLKIFLLVYCCHPAPSQPCLAPALPREENSRRKQQNSIFTVVVSVREAKLWFHFLGWTLPLVPCQHEQKKKKLIFGVPFELVRVKTRQLWHSGATPESLPTFWTFLCLLFHSHHL